MLFCFYLIDYCANKSLSNSQRSVLFLTETVILWTKQGNSVKFLLHKT